MSKINLNEESYDALTFPEFNKGNPGIVESLNLVVTKRKPDEEGRWDYRIDFSSEEAGSISLYFTYVDETKENAGKAISAQGVGLKHLIHALFGPIEFPEFSDARQMLDWCMSQAVLFKDTVRLAVCYGTKKAPSDRLRIKKFVPFIENSNVLKADSKLKFSTGDNFVPFKAEEIDASKMPDYLK